MLFVVVLPMLFVGDGGRHGDVDEDDLHLHPFCAPKTCDLNVAALRTMKGKNG